MEDRTAGGIRSCEHEPRVRARCTGRPDGLGPVPRSLWCNRRAYGHQRIVGVQCLTCENHHPRGDGFLFLPPPAAGGTRLARTALRSHRPGSLTVGPTSVTFAAHCDRYQVRAVGRMAGGIVPGAFLAGSLIDIPDTLPGSTDRAIDIAVAAVAAAALLILLRKFGQGRGILWGLWVWFVSWVWWQSLVLSAYAAWLAAGCMATRPTGPKLP